jgi:hypothetical protein
MLGLGLSAAAQRPTPGWNTPWRNADGSLKDAVELGGGYNTTVGAARAYQGTGWSYRAGGGYRLNHLFAALIEYNYDYFGIPRPLVSSYFPGDYGNVHLWSLTLEPTADYFSTEHLGGYLIGGGGFYRKVNVIRPACPAGGGTCSFAPGDTAAHFSNNAVGANIGAGFGWRVWDSSNAKLFIEARYVWVDNTPSSHNIVFPPANQRTSYTPLTGGVRW